MRSIRVVESMVAVVLAVAFITGCSGAASTPAPSPSASATDGLVLSEADAVARVLTREPRFAGIQPRDPDLIGQAAWYQVVPASGVGAFIVTMRIGWGDCPSGCIDEHTWTYAVLPDGTVDLQSEAGGTVPPDAWPAPGGGEGRTGIHVTALAGPTCPVETVPPDPACAPRPVPNATVSILDDAGQEQAVVVLDTAGQAFVGLAAGAYTVHGQGAAGFMNGPEIQRVVVQEGQVTEVTLSYDTGIR